ncbi:MAG TPA: ribonuclease H-like domain-containing protein [Dictyoglomaceae bacterium]|nr:ribonuclease H-like domain-containing protein [Dictyoglomaceae bacterium]HOL39336.1 ribonuclease H-like domain-containing protein [Dictyoglomaceae bacterium]HPP15982.1 ribonuclease H-like domain-containing protein [Dictyoglomaceae bacterium]
MSFPYTAYLDIETTGLSPIYSDITVIGIYLENLEEERFIQLIGDEITPFNLMLILEKVKDIYTFNGSRFDLPFIREKLGIDLKELFIHHDLMYKCWERNLYGGLKAVERKLGIERKLKEVDGRLAVILWERYVRFDDKYALEMLLLYNREDVINLKILREKLEEFNQLSLGQI